MRRTQGWGGVLGFTVVELLVVLAVLGIALSIALPGFGALAERTHIRRETNRLLMAIYWARAEAVKRSRNVVFCPRGGGEGQRCGGRLEDGWLLFVDADRDRDLGAADVILRRFPPVHPNISVTNRSGTRAAGETLVFRPDGTARRALTFTLCSRSRPDIGPRSIVLNRVGRPRVASDWGRCRSRSRG